MRKGIPISCYEWKPLLIFLMGLAPLLLGSRCAVAEQSGHSRKTTAVLVAPFCITNQQFTSSMLLSNRSRRSVTVLVRRDSLEGEEVGRTKLKIASKRTITISLDALYKPGHDFGTLGPIFVSGESGPLSGVDGEVSISSKDDSHVLVNEPLQHWNSTSGTIMKASVPAHLSVPVLAVLNMTTASQHVSVTCTANDGEHYESDFTLPANLTFLVNACITSRNQSRKYDQLLNGDSGSMRKAALIQVESEIPGGLCIWGFAAGERVPGRLIRLAGIEFSEKHDPEDQLRGGPH